MFFILKKMTFLNMKIIGQAQYNTTEAPYTRILFLKIELVQRKEGAKVAKESTPLLASPPSRIICCFLRI